MPNFYCEGRWRIHTNEMAGGKSARRDGEVSNMPVNLTDEEIELVLAELNLDVNMLTTKALRKLFWNYCLGLDAIEASRKIYQGIPALNFSEYERI